MDTKDHIKIFEQSSELLIVIDTNFAIMIASDAFLKTTLTVRENIVGCDIFDVFPDNPDDKTANGESKMRASFNRVIKNKTTDTLPIVKYDIPKPESEGGGFELKYWRVVNSPVLDENNNVKYIIQRAKDLTENKTLTTQLEFDKKALKLVADSEKRYNMLLMKSPFAFAVLKGKNKVITFANDSVKEIWGKGKNIEGKPLIEVLPEMKDSPFLTILEDVYKTGIPYYGNETLAPKHIKGQKEDVYFDFVYQPYLEADETISGVTIIAYEVTEQVNARKKINESEKQLQNIFSTAPAAIAVLEGSDLKYVLANANYQKMTNRSEAQLLGKSMLEVFPELIGTGAFEIFENIFKTGEAFSVAEYPTVLDKNNDGVLQQVYYKFTAEPIKDADGKFNSIMVLAFDVTEQINVRKKIEDSDKRYNMMLMKSPFAFAVFKGKDMEITLANDSIKEMWGKGKNIEGRFLLEVLPEIKDSAFPGLIDNVYTTGIPFYGDELLAQILRDGKQEDAYYNFVYQPYLEADETISGVTVIAYEVTAAVMVKKALKAQHEAEQKALKKIEESNKRYHMILMQSPFAFSIMKGKDMVITLANDLIKEFWGKGKDVEGKTLLQVLPELELQPFPAMLDKVYTTGIPVYANEILAKLNHNGKIENRYFNIVYQPYFEADEIISGVTTIAHDVTAQVISKNKLTEAKDNAEQKTKIAEEVVKAKQQFLSNMSHEIRTPMNSIIGFTNVVLKTDLNKEQKEYIRAIKVSGDALLVLINDILDLAKVDAGKMTFEQSPFALSASIAATLHLFAPKIQEKNLELIEKYDSAIPEILLGDSVRLRQITLNLLSNAVKFTDEGKITVSVRMLKEEADNITIEFSVKDTGIGIPKNKLEHIFGDFQQATNETSRLHGGTGLGLSIVKQFVELQGGTLFVNSKPGEGSTFGFILNFKRAIAETTEMADITGTDNGVKLAGRIENIRILVAEDLPLNQLLIKIILKDFGFDVDIAGNGKIAIEKLQENKYDIILMDLLMPELNGFEATEHIRNKMNSQIPIIALTADVTTVDVEKCKAIGMNDYISKPVDEKLLFSKIVELVKKK